MVGAARRVGRAVALELARAGCEVSFTSNTSSADADSLTAELDARGAMGRRWTLNLDDSAAVEQWGAAAARDLPQLRTLVLCASSYDATPLDSLTASDALRHYRINALAPLLICKHMAPSLRRAADSRCSVESARVPWSEVAPATEGHAPSTEGHSGCHPLSHREAMDKGCAAPVSETSAAPQFESLVAPLSERCAASAPSSIVAFSDIHAIGRPRRHHAAYSMSKAALTEMVRTLAVELAPRVRVNAIAPGVIAFPETGPESDPEMQRRYLSRVPLGRAGTPEEAAQVVRWLALEAHYITGEVIRLDGGRWLT